MKHEIMNGPLIILCQTDGRIIAVNRGLTSDADFKNLFADEAISLTELSRRLGCAGLPAKFEAFTKSEKSAEDFSLDLKNCRMRKLDGGGDQSSILIELNSPEIRNEQKFLLEAGRMTARLVHDFKNQLGGLKLYSAYLKKRFSDQPEGLEIAEKIIQSLNSMAEHATLVSKLTRPIELNRELKDPAQCVNQVVDEMEIRAGARKLKLDREIETGLQPLSLDLQHLRGALGSIIARAIDSSPEGGVIAVKLQSGPDGIVIEIVDHGETLSEEQRKSMFNFISNERLNTVSLDLAMAQRIIEQHGGHISAYAASTQGTVVQVKLP